MENNKNQNKDRSSLSRTIPTDSRSTETRSIPARDKTEWRTTASVSSGNVPRPTPIRNRENSDTGNNVRSIPTTENTAWRVNRSVPSGNVPRPTPVNRVEDANAKTRQIPVQNTNGNVLNTENIGFDPNAETVSIQIQKTGNAVPAPKKITPDVNTQTRQIPLQKSNTPARNITPPQKKTDASPASGRSTISRTAPANPASAEVKARTIPTASGDNSRRTVPVNHAKSPRSIPNTSEKQKITLSENGANDQTKLVDTSAQSIAEANYGTRIIKTTNEVIPDSGKKKNSQSSRKKNDPASGNTIVSIIKAVVYIVAVLVISVTASLFIILAGNDIYAFVKSDEVVEVTIPEGADLTDVAMILSNNGVIKYPSIFEWYADHNNDNGVFVAGTYSIACNLDYEDLLASFKPKEIVGTTWITFPEGFTTDEIIDLLVENGIGTKEKYIDVINNYPFDYWFVHELDNTNWKNTGRFYRLDGYLFPDTYEFYNDSSEEAVITKLLSRFNVIFGKKYREAAEEMGMTTDEVVILASMIEKESNNAADIYIISSVFHNRINNPAYETQGRLESDATVLYSIHHKTGERPTKAPTGLGNDNGEYADDAYNTYRIKGLPPGAIANPSASTLSAALNPENTDFYYFVFDGIENHFSKTKYEHDLVIDEINRRNPPAPEITE